MRFWWTRDSLSPPIVDLSSPEVRRDPYPTYGALRRHWPVYHDAARNVWIVSRYADVIRVLREPEVFSSRVASFETTLLGADGAAHARVRRVVGGAFTAATVKELAGLVRSLAGELVEGIATRGECELIGDFAQPLPLSVVAAMLGIDRARLGDLERWAAALLHLGNPSLSKSARLSYETEVHECRAFLTQHLAQLARNPRNPYVPHFLTGTDDGGLTIRERVDVGQLLIVAGTETTVSLVGNSMLLLLRDPASQHRLRAETRLIPHFIEEVLRYESPVQRTSRVTLRPAAIAGVQIPQGALVEILIGSANRDPDKFADADQFRIDRNPNEHIAFGLGRHLCLGSQLARLEAAIALETLLQRFPDVIRSKPEKPIEFGSVAAVRGPIRLHLCFRPRALTGDA